MAIAVFKSVKCTGTNAATETDANNHPCYLAADIHTENTALYPVGAPKDLASSPNYSFETWLTFECTSAPDQYCQNFKFYGPNQQPDAGDNPGNKMTIMAGTTPTGVTPTDNPSSVATVVQHTNYYSPGTALSLPVIPGDDVIDAVGERTEFLVLQLKVEYEVQKGDMETQSYVIDYEEV
jgi:hypothetical protein